MELSNRKPPGVSIEDLSEGSGRIAAAGSVVRIRTRGRLNRGESIDYDEENGDIAEFRIGERQIIPGLERGVIGMREGGTRRLPISPHLAYGDSGVPDRIPPGAVLEYDVELLSCD
ncbi:MAG: peptidylprolyl isomerase [Verrucomicrobiales bacterium]|nr:peptidylprolyl isomerase [Verrucomicrobiales bacterium]